MSTHSRVRLDGGVPLGRRMLFADRRRACLTIAGVAVSLLVVLLLQGIFAGAIHQVTSYLRSSPADLIVSQAGVRTMHMSTSTLPRDTATAAAQLPGVAWAAPIGFASGPIAGPRGRQLTYLVGYDTGTGHGGPAALAAGRAPDVGEAVVAEQGAADLGLDIGDTATVLGRPLRVVGLSESGTSITNTTVFVSQEQFTQLRGPKLSYLLVKTEPSADNTRVAAELRQALGAVTVQTRQQFIDSEARIVTDMSADLLKLMSLVGLLIGLAVIALGLMAATLRRTRDFAVLKALGASTGRLLRSVTVQVLWTVTSASVLATLGVLVVEALLDTAGSSVHLRITVDQVAVVTAQALLAGLLAALWPLRRIARLDAATAFRETR